MTIPSFDLLQPTSLSKACRLLSELGDDARPIAGGTALVALMKQRVLRLSALVDLQSIPGLDRIAGTGGAIRIGALATHRAVETSSLIRSRIPLLGQVFSHVGNIRIRQTATVGGNLAHADYRLDPPPALLVLDAEVAVAGTAGERTLPFKELYRDSYETVLEPGEIITELRIPPMPGKAAASYTRYSSLGANDWPCLGIAALLSLEHGCISELRLGLSGLAATPVLVRRLEQFTGRRVSEELSSDIAGVVDDQIAPVSDLRGSAGYKRAMAAVFTSRALRELSERAGHG